ncbi:predicted protein [Lichtheimia corymbifera JMRC:FSU:9682]|uniref:C3H1-type domain-containing protein n=1 Tax=Lichtheimia corymbifera JMRC:FSU:9682 TaxID=1263082 RepID=A0A068RVM8_9FUNG|nr:predicted protein [Lichtheimia corymbifera JMRC:FSU:9682]
MKLSSTQLASLREKLPDTLGQYVEADPEALTDFVMMFVERENGRDELQKVFREELAVFCEDASKTEQAVNDLLRLIDTVQNEGGSANVQQTTNDDTSAAASAGQKRDKHDDDDDEEEDDDDRNFKRRNVSTTAPADASPPSPRSGDKRTYAAEGDDRPSKQQVRGDEQSRLSGLPSHLRQRLGASSSGGEQRRRAPCRNFEERGYCVYGDSCKFDHGEEQITVNDYSKFQAIMGSSGAMGMNPMIMQNPDQMYHFQMGMDGMPYMTTAPIESAEGQDQPQQQPRHHQQRQSPHHPRPRQQRDGRMGKFHDQPFTTRYDPNNNTIVVDKIPMDSCNMEAVTETFKKFGTIVDISLQPEFQRAFIEYKTHAEALAAHQCPDVLFKNRFVKVYWKKVDDKQQKQQSWQHQQQQQQQQQQQAEPDPEVIKQRAAELAKIREEKQKQRKEQLEKQIEANKRKQEIAKRELELAMLKAKVKAMEDSKKETP